VNKDEDGGEGCDGVDVTEFETILEIKQKTIKNLS
jgi:hypothetical protein